VWQIIGTVAEIWSAESQNAAAVISNHINFITSFSPPWFKFFSFWLVACQFLCETDRTQVPFWTLLNGRNVLTTPQTAPPSSNGGESWSRNQVIQKCRCMRGSTNVTIFSFRFQWQCIRKAHLGHTYIRCESTHFHGLVDTKLRSKVAYKLYNVCSWFQITW